jgi:hypothetical protein
MKMPKVLSCDETACAYNREKNCHALAITVGDSGCPMCDTCIKSNVKGGDESSLGSVGACKNEQCDYNSSLECTASNIKIGRHGGHADCMTFTPRK